MSTATQQRGAILAERLGIAVIGTEGHDRKAACIACNSSDGLRIDQATGKAFCFVCESRWSPFNLALACLDKPQAIDLMVEIGEFEPRENQSGNRRPHEDLVTTVPRLKRVSPPVLRTYGAKPAQRGKLTVCRIPVWNEHGERHSYFDLSLDGSKGWFRKGAGSSGLFFPGRLPQSGETWLIVEGVNDAADLHGLEFLAVGLNTSKMAVKYIRLFRDVDVVIVPDRHRAGEERAETTAARLHGVARSVRIATLPDEFKEKDGADVRDVLALKDGETLLRQALEDAREWKPSDTEIGNENESHSLPSLFVAQGRIDLTNSLRFADLHLENVLYVGPWKRWLTWNAKRWRIDEINEIDQRAKDVPQILWTNFVKEQTK